MPSQAHRRNPDGTTSDVDLEQLQPGDVVVVKPGENIPADGDVLKGRSSVDESMLTGIFEPFVQLQQPGVAKSRRTGLGLPLCRQFATLIGGEVRVESEVGVGTTFILTLPPGSRF